MFSENMASLGGDDLSSRKTQSDEHATHDAVTAATTTTTATDKPEDAVRKPLEREDRLRLIKDRQNEERQRKLEELKAQAIAAQKYREQKEEERRRRIDDMRSKEMDRKQQVEERKKAIMDAERDRRDYIVRKNQERDSRIETKRRNERTSIAFAFGSSTPRLLDPVDVGSMSPSSLWGHRRSTSITNVAYSGAPLTRRSSERELSDGPKKRATSAGGLDRNEDDTDSAPLSYRSVARRKTDLMPTIPSPRETSFGSRSSLYCHTPRTPGRTVSMTRLDQLAQPIRRNGEHIRALIERQKQQSDPMSNSISAIQTGAATTNQDAKKARHKSRSLTHLAGGNAAKKAHHNQQQQHHSAKQSGGTSPLHPLTKKSTSKSMTQLITGKLARFSLKNKVQPATATTPNSGGGSVDADDNLPGTGSRSGEVTPGASRPGSALSTSTSVSGVLYRRTTSARKPRPASIAGTGMSIDTMKDIHKQKKDGATSKPPIPKVQSTIRKSMTTSLSNGIGSNGNSSAPSVPATPKETPKRTVDKLPPSAIKKTPLHSRMTMSMSAATTPIAVASPAAQSTPAHVNISKVTEASVVSAAEAATGSAATSTTTTTTIITTVTTNNETQNMEQVISDAVDEIVATAAVAVEQQTNTADTLVPVVENAESHTKNISETVVEVVSNTVEIIAPEVEEVYTEVNDSSVLLNANNTLEFSTPDRHDGSDVMSASMIQRRITTEEQAKAALAERRRLAREEAERQAELERQRVEADQLAEEQRIAEEEEMQRRFEEDTLRLAEEQRKAEELRLLQAIQEAAEREEVERQRREEEERQKIERDEQERKAREENEKQKIEVAERLKKEEKEREERRKRVEAIMSRTRAKGTPNKSDEKDGGNGGEKMNESMTASNMNDEKCEQPSVKSPQTPAQEAATTISDYEKSVTDKENALINSFSNLIDSNNRHSQLIHSHHNVKTNGKALDFDLVNEDQILLRNSAISNGNGHTDNISLDNTIESTGMVVTNTIDNKVSQQQQQQQQVDSITSGQLIDFNLDTNQSTIVLDPVNFNNNSLMTSSPANLVTSDGHENKDLSLL